MKKQKIILIALILLALLGCSKSASNGLYPVYSFPDPPKAVTEPGKVWLQCGGNTKAVESGMYCIDPAHVSELRKFIIEQDSVIEKYFNLITKHNDAVN